MAHRITVGRGPARTAVFLISLVLFLSNVAAGSPLMWSWEFKHQAFCGTGWGASDSYDSSDILKGDYARTVYVGTYHETGTDGWTGPTGFYDADVREPFDLTPGNSKTWRIYLWGDSTLPDEAWYIALPWEYDGSPYDPVFEVFEFTLEYVRPAIGMPGEWTPPVGHSPSVGTVVVLNDLKEGGWMFPAFRTDNGLDGYVFDFTATVIPEPSALAALLCGLGGVLLRRRR